ncbi:MAG: TldD/PmbA family protein [Candidatus Methanodesulfokora sp.]
MSDLEGYEESLGFVEDILDLLYKQNLDEAAVHVRSARGDQIRFSSNKIDIANTWLDFNADIQLVKDRRIQIVSVASPDIDAAKLQIERAMKVIGSLPERKAYDELPEGPFSYPIIEGIYDPKLEDPGEKLSDIVTAAINSGLSSGAKKIAGSIRSGVEISCVATTTGVKVCEKRSNVYLDIRAFVSPESTGHSFSCSRMMNEIRPEEAGREAAEDALMSSKQVKVEPGRHDALIWYSAIGNLGGVFGSLAGAMYVMMQMSPYVSKLNEQIGSDLISIVDDPLRPGGYGSRSFDMEGYPTRRNVILEKGFLRTYLHNRLTAKAMNTNTTANAGWVSPQPWNIVISPGDMSNDELIEELRDGLIIRNATYLRFQDYRAGDFSAIIRDGLFKVEKGEIVGSARGLRLSDNVLRMLSNVFAVGRNSRQIYHWWMEWEVPVESPPIAVRNVGFTSATM